MAKESKFPFVEFLVEGMPGVYAIEGAEEKGFRFTYDVNEIVSAEITTGLNLWAAVRNLDQMSAGQLRAITFALLKAAHPKITLNEAGDLLAFDPPAVIAALRKVLKVKSQDEVVLESLQRLALENPTAVLEMFSRAGVVFTLGSGGEGGAGSPPTDSSSPEPSPVQ